MNTTRDREGGKHFHDWLGRVANAHIVLKTTSEIRTNIRQNYQLTLMANYVNFRFYRFSVEPWTQIGRIHKPSEKGAFESISKPSVGDIAVSAAVRGQTHTAGRADLTTCLKPSPPWRSALSRRVREILSRHTVILLRWTTLGVLGPHCSRGFSRVRHSHVALSLCVAVIADCSIVSETVPWFLRVVVPCENDSRLTRIVDRTARSADGHCAVGRVSGENSKNVRRKEPEKRGRFSV